MCRSDSGADTRDSENTFPASLADERKKRESGENTQRQEEVEKDRKKNVNEPRREIKRAQGRDEQRNPVLLTIFLILSTLISLPLSAFPLLLSP